MAQRLTAWNLTGRRVTAIGRPWSSCRTETISFAGTVLERGNVANEDRCRQVDLAELDAVEVVGTQADPDQVAHRLPAMGAQVSKTDTLAMVALSPSVCLLEVRTVSGVRARGRRRGG